MSAETDRFFNAVIFDVDGVLVDSEYVFLNSIQQFLRTNGILVSFEDLAGFLGKPEAEITEIVRNRYHLEEQYSFDAVWHGIYDGYAAVMESGKVQPMSDLNTFLAYLKRHGILTAVATSGTMHHYEQIYRGIGLSHEFDVIVTFEDVTRGKPDPEIFLKAVKRLEEKGVKKGKIAVIEDSPNGILAAKCADLFTFGYKGSKIIQDTSKADLEICSFQEMIQFMEKGENSVV